MEEPVYKLFCLTCEEVTPHKIVLPDSLEPIKDEKGAGAFGSVINNIVVGITGVLSQAAVGDKYECEVCGARFDEAEETNTIWDHMD